jgi:hypothetical protein
MVESGDEAIVLCTACGRRQVGSPHLCEYCGAPLTAHGSTDPVLGIFSRGFAARQATTNPRKPIVVIGIWLWMAPTVLLGLMMGSMALSAMLQGIHESYWGQAAGALLGVLVSAAMTFIPFAILVRTTEAYFRQRNARSATDDSGDISDTDAQEPTKCLACGQTMPDDSGTCPACGWSFTEPDA